MHFYFFPWPRVDLGKLVLLDITIRVHLHNLIVGGRTQNLYNLHKLIDVAVRSEDGLQSNHLNEDAACRPGINLGRVSSASEDQLWGSIAPRANVGKIGLSLLQSLC
jgi:hypothetical protein